MNDFKKLKKVWKESYSKGEDVETQVNLAIKKAKSRQLVSILEIFVVAAITLPTIFMGIKLAFNATLLVDIVRSVFLILFPLGLGCYFFWMKRKSWGSFDLTSHELCVRAKGIIENDLKINNFIAKTFLPLVLFTSALVIGDWVSKATWVVNPSVAVIQLLIVLSVAGFFFWMAKVFYPNSNAKLRSELEKINDIIDDEVI